MKNIKNYKQWTITLFKFSFDLLYLLYIYIYTLYFIFYTFWFKIWFKNNFYFILFICKRLKIIFNSYNFIKKVKIYNVSKEIKEKKLFYNVEI